jgi:tetratricopeptide (TPR) repeat protein
MTNCLSEETLRSWLSGALSPAEDDSVCTHVHDCARCQALLDLETQYSGLRRCLDVGKATEVADLDGTVLGGLIDRIQDALLARKEPRGLLRSGEASPVVGGAETIGDIGRIGSFRLLNELGQGGMGIVYRAWDEPLQRLVALKVLRPELAGEADRKSLIREAQLAACFHNDHAVMIHAVVNPEGGLPYLVMEYVQGLTLAELIGSKERLAPRRVATLVAQVALALEAAHAAGLIHRDVKPSNILIEEKTDRPKITDFGLARSQTVASGLTREGVVAGTPTYMSPEQARGESQLDARTDVYSLGATLYEALTGEIPFRGAPHLVLRRVIEEDPRPPRQYSDQVPRDLETICLKAMAREPARRYQTAGAMAGDLQRWLGGEPILARPTGRFERGVLWCRRNPRVAGLAASLIVTLLVGFLAVVWQWRRAERNADRAELNRQKSDASLKDAQASFDGARRAVDQFYTRFYEQGVLNVPGLEKVRREVLLEMIRYYKDFLDQHRNDPALGRELAETCQRIGNLTKDQGNKVDALNVLREAVQFFDRLPAEERADVRIQTRLYVSLDYIAQLEADLGDIESARRDYQRALGIIEKILPKEPGNLRRKRGMAVLLGNYANMSVAANDKIEARRGYLKALGIQKDLVRQEPAQLDFKNDLALTYHNLAFLEENPQENRVLLEQALTLRKHLVEVNPGNALFRRHLGRTYGSLGQNQLSLGHTQEALSYLRESRALLHQVVVAHPNTTANQGYLAGACGVLGRALASLGQHEEAQEAYKEARTMYQNLVQSNSESTENKKSLLEIEADLAKSEKASKLRNLESTESKQ